MTTLETLADQIIEPTPAAAEQPKSVPTDAQTDGAAGDDQEGQEAQKEEAKSFSQEEVDEIIRKRVAKAEARAERRVMRALEKIAPAQAPQVQPQPQDDGRPTRSQYANDEAYVEALTDWKLDQRERQSQAKQAESKQREVVSKTETLYAEASKVDGFDRESFDELPLTATIVQTLLDSDVAPRLMAHMAANPEEVERISRLPAHRQAAEIGKLEDRIASQRPAKTSNAPRPISPVGARGSAATTDPERMSMAEYAEMRKTKGPLWHWRKT